MSPSTVQRERLIGPVGLILLVALFAVAFLILKPASVPGDSVIVRLEQAGWSQAAVLALDDLDFAYIKARQATGEISDADVVKVILAMMQADRVADATQILAQYPQLSIDAQSRSVIDLELAAADSDDALAAALLQLKEKRQLHSTAALQRATVLSERLQQPALTQELYAMLAMRDDVDKVRVYQQCGQFLAAQNLKPQASECYTQALQAGADRTQSLQIELALLALLPTQGAEQQALVDSLLNKQNLSATQKQTLASALLSAERPDAAYRIFARLAMTDVDNAEQWLVQAAKWAQAANRLSDAAAFFEALVRRSDGQRRQMYQQEVIRVLVAAGESDKAFERLVKQLAGPALAELDTEQRQVRDTQLALAIVEARKLGKTQQALDWNTQRLLLDPDNAQLLGLQAELALAVADLPLALELARRAVASSPDNVATRESLARVSEWNALPVEASQQWLWLSTPANQSDEGARRQALRELVRLGGATFQSAVAARALRELTLLSDPADDDVRQLVSLYALEGQPEEAANALNDITIVHGNSPFVLRTLAMHQYQNQNYAGSLDAWQKYEGLYGDSSDVIIHQMELLWRLDRTDEAAKVAQKLRGRTLLSQASDYQLQVMAEIAWQHRMPWLATLVQPSLQTLAQNDMRLLYGRRSLATLQEQGSDNAALTEAVRLWQSTGETGFALTAMQLAFKRGDQRALDEFQPGQSNNSELRLLPDYWERLAGIRLRGGDRQGARAAYEQALKLDAGHVESIAGSVWMDIAQADPAQLQKSLNRYDDVAVREPVLWEAMAVGHLALGAATTSVQWFERLLGKMESDYGMLLTYADALEYSGRAADAQKVRRYTLTELRPVLARGSAEERSLILRQYARLSLRYGSTNENESLVGGLVYDLQNDNFDDPQEAIWREDIAISWLMSTQRNEQARIVMTNLHAGRLQAPAWQRLALALNSNDKQAVQAIVQAQGPMSVGNHVLALRQLGLDRQAYALAQNALQPDALNPGMTPDDMRSLSQQYASIRADLPSYVSASVGSRDIAGISSLQRGVSVRHSPTGLPFGVGLEVSQRQLSTSEFNYDGDDQLDDIALSLFFGGSMRGGQITAGVSSSDDDDQSYASASWFMTSANDKRRYSVDAAYREQLTDSGELFLGARQNRASASIDASLGRLPYLRVQANAMQINTRLGNERFADGFGAQAELGVRGRRSGNNWSANVLAGQTNYERSDSLPIELQLRDGSTVGSVLQDVSRRVSVGASLSRGVVNSGFPQSGTARYFLNARLGHSWPARKVGLSADAGAGIRVLGGDELSFTVSHDTQGVSRSRGTFTSLGINYRYHF